MFKTKTVFVVGAGASSEVGLPYGKGFKNELANTLDINREWAEGRATGDQSIAAALNERMKATGKARDEIHKYLNAARSISKILPLEASIDELLFHHSGNNEMALCGKLAIARRIIDAEKDSALYPLDRGEIDFRRIADSWFDPLWKLMKQGSHANDPSAIFQNVSFIVFNYDRCIEHFLYHALQRSSGLSSVDAAQVLQNLQIFHPYGSLGKLPWQNSADPTDFGENVLSDEKLLAVADSIKTVSDGLGDQTERTKIQSAIREARTIIFIGFAFHEQNMRLMKPKDNSSYQVRIFATAKGIAESDASAVKEKISELLDGGMYVEQVVYKSCVDFFGECSHRLSML